MGDQAIYLKKNKINTGQELISLDGIQLKRGTYILSVSVANNSIER